MTYFYRLGRTSGIQLIVAQWYHNDHRSLSILVLHVRRQAISRTNADLCQLNPWEQTSVKNCQNTTIFIQENALEAIFSPPQCVKTHWGWVKHICVSKQTIIGSDNGLSPGRHRAIMWTNDGILLIPAYGTNFSEIISEIHTFSFKKMRLKTSSAKWRPFCLGLNMLIHFTAWVVSSTLTARIYATWPSLLYGLPSVCCAQVCSVPNIQAI